MFLVGLSCRAASVKLVGSLCLGQRSEKLPRGQGCRLMSLLDAGFPACSLRRTLVNPMRSNANVLYQHLHFRPNDLEAAVPNKTEEVKRRNTRVVWASRETSAVGILQSHFHTVHSRPKWKFQWFLRDEPHLCSLPRTVRMCLLTGCLLVLDPVVELCVFFSTLKDPSQLSSPWRHTSCQSELVKEQRSCFSNETLSVLQLLNFTSELSLCSISTPDEDGTVADSWSVAWGSVAVIFGLPRAVFFCTLVLQRHLLVETYCVRGWVKRESPQPQTHTMNLPARSGLEHCWGWEKHTLLIVLFPGLWGDL